MEAVRAHFRPEFFNRIDEQIIFKPLSREDLKKIVELQLRYLSKRTAEQGITLDFTDRLKEALATEGYDPVYGARPLKRLIQRKVQDELAMEILKGDVAEGAVITVDADGSGNAVFSKKGEKRRAAAS